MENPSKLYATYSNHDGVEEFLSVHRTLSGAVKTAIANYQAGHLVDPKVFYHHGSFGESVRFYEPIYVNPGSPNPTEEHDESVYAAQSDLLYFISEVDLLD